jgi:pimeloyl-ACP methyl ester carboxylesterase
MTGGWPSRARHASSDRQLTRPRRAGAAWIALAVAGAAMVLAQELAARVYYARTPGPRRFRHEEERTAWTPLWRENGVALEWLALRRSPVHRGDGVARGDGAPVLLVPGFGMKGGYLGELRGWLARMGHAAEVAAIGRNTDCWDVHTQRLADAVRQAGRRAGRPVHLVGHSLGGILARAAAARSPMDVASVAVLGSPFRGLYVHAMLRLAAAAVRAKIRWHRGATVRPRCATLACDCDSVRALAAPLPASVPQLAIVSRGDGAADWRYCADPATTRVVEVRASHVGLVLSPDAYAALAAHLAMAAAQPRAAGPAPG